MSMTAKIVSADFLMAVSEKVPHLSSLSFLLMYQDRQNFNLETTLNVSMHCTELGLCIQQLKGRTRARSCTSRLGFRMLDVGLSVMNLDQ